MQDDPLFEKLDRMFSSAEWTSDFPNTMAFPLARLGSDHIPIHIQVGAHIPKAQLFKLENYWFEFDGIMELILDSWNMAPIKQDSALNINIKFKYLRAAMEKWSRNHSNLHKIIDNCSYTLALLDGIEEQRSLSIMEKNFRRILKAHTPKLLETKIIYWTNRAKMRWEQLGDENTKKIILLPFKAIEEIILLLSRMTMATTLLTMIINLLLYGTLTKTYWVFQITPP
jgi:hypothetical protein